MDKHTYHLLESYMLSCMEDSAHDKDHVYRVLYNALEIAKGEKGVDYDVLICACLLHDIGRKEQLKYPRKSHAEIGGEMAYQFLTEHQFDASYVKAVRHCIDTHSYRKNDLAPQTLEAKILFDADKLDVTGAIGIARTLLYKGEVGEPLYRLDSDGKVSDGEHDTAPSFFQEYKYKLEKVYSRFFTKRGAELAKLRQQTAKNFYEDLLTEASASYEHGLKDLKQILE